MVLTCVGTGTAAPQADHVCSGFLLETHGLRMLLDCGPGVVHNMARHALPWRDLTHVLITHYHNDHIGDVPMLFFAWKHGMRPPRTAPLTIIGPHGTRRLIGRMGDAMGEHMRNTTFEPTVLEVADGEELRLSPTVRLRVIKTRHTDESIGYRVEADERSFCYPGDTGFSDSVARFAQGVDALLIECAVPDDEAMEIHLCPSELARLARIAMPRRLLITHVYPQLERASIPGSLQAAGWTAPATLVSDGQRIEL